MKGAYFSASTLYVDEIYFLIAWRDEPPRSFKFSIALLTMVAVAGCAACFAGFLGAAFFGVVGLSAETGADTSSLSAIVKQSKSEIHESI